MYTATCMLQICSLSIHLPSLLVVVVKIPSVVPCDYGWKSICQLCLYEYVISVVVTCEGVKAFDCRPKFQPQKFVFQGEKVPYIHNNTRNRG